MDLILTERPDGVTFAVKIRAGAGRTAITGFWNGALKLNVAKAPVQGEANRACVRFLADCLGVPRTAVEIIAGDPVVVRLVGTNEEEGRRGTSVAWEALRT